MQDQEKEIKRLEEEIERLKQESKRLENELWEISQRRVSVIQKIHNTKQGVELLILLFEPILIFLLFFVLMSFLGYPVIKCSN
jgi:sugar-specific transcriptional regulator TrmB